MDKQIVAKKLRLLRGDRKREEVAIACGITAQAIAMYESGKRIPSDDIKVKIANFFGTTVQQIFFEI